MTNGQAIVSLHDVTPAFQDEIRTGLHLVEKWGLPSPALLVVPSYHNGWDIGRDRSFVRLLDEARARGSEIVLHGLNHLAPRRVKERPTKLKERLKTRFLTAGEGEFQYLSRQEAQRRIIIGRETVENALGVQTAGFIPPAWLLGEEAGQAVRGARFEFCEDHLFIHHLRRDRRLFAPAVSFTARSRTRALSSIAWAHGMRLALHGRHPVRLALHPVDFRFPRLVKAIAGLAEKMGQKRNWVGYTEFLEMAN